jgi:two-component system CheB/CheR fusion protein
MAGRKKPESPPKPQSKDDSASMPGPSTEAAAPHAERRVPVAGIGASAGGLDAFKKFFAAMPIDSGVAFILIPHLDPTHESMMVELIARQTKMSVVEAKEGMKVEANRVYIIPPNKYMTIQSGVLRLTGPVERRGLQTPIDLFLRSLAEDQQELAICVILSGTGSHGTLGLKAVKAVGGMTMVQDPKTAEYDRMPWSAVGSGLADFVLPPEQLPEALVKYVQHFYVNGGTPAPAVLEAPDLLPQILAVLKTRAKFDFSSYRKKMLLRRVERRMGLNQVEHLPAYLQALREDPEEVKRLARDLLISVTSFFRDPEAYRALETQVLPALIQSKERDTPIRVWVPGCATGEEPYSVAILLLEQLAARQMSNPVQVFATDLDEDALEEARLGVYPENIIADVSPERLSRYFTRTDEHSFQVSKQLRETVVFAIQNAIADPPFSKLDLISCRNLLIYLEPEVQRKLINLLHFALNEGGFLFLGPSDTVGRHVDLFEAVDKKWRIYRRIGPNRPERIEFPVVTHTGLRGENKRSPGPPAKRTVNFAELTQQFLLDTYAPAAVLINRKHEILYFFGPTMRYLDQPTGEPTQDLMLLAREGLGHKLRTSVHKAIRDKQIAVESGIRLKRNGDQVAITLTVRPFQWPGTPEGLLLITFQDEVGPTPPTPPSSETAPSDSLVRQLEYELKATREDLQSTIEELESSNEELKAANEEVMSMNEELQSGNEELETSKEELQSLNEELGTVNSQLNDKVEELESANNDMANLLNCTDIGTVFLDTGLRIKRYTPAATKQFNVIATDVGRPIMDITPKFTDPELQRDSERVIQDLLPLEKEIATEDGRWCLRRISLYRTLDNRIDGVVITFVNITGRKQMEEELRRLNEKLEQLVADRTQALQASEELNRAILNYAAEGIITIDEHGTVESFNKAAEDMFRYEAEEVIGRNVNMLMPHPYHGEHDQYLSRYLTTGVRKIIGFRRELTGRRKDGSTFAIDLAVSEVRNRDRLLFAGIVRDISQRKALEREILATAEREQIRMGQDLHDIVGQELSGLALLAKNLTDSPKKDKDLAGRMTEGLKRVLRQVRSLSQGLIAIEFGPGGLTTALEDLAARISEQAGVICTFRCSQPVAIKDREMATQLYRISQEAITNALVHGEAKNIAINLEQNNSNLVLSIQNDGTTMPEPPAAGKSGIGLKIMQHRAELINGTLTVKPVANGGTAVTCVLHRGDGKP